MTDPIAPEGKLWICCACGKWATDLFHGEKDSPLWDESCVLNAQLFDKDRLVWNGNMVIEVKAIQPTTETK